ncbi:hypothetical protein DPMN_080021 [Dreissena polymorpha]|uniref:Uncharacterized protein n=1 Tax=Dreissena polymorpha TaxID=45954 RepID=A0A9D4BQL9_DREPO|nr:hypothetical protein DPMN_080021 [Dreissena polymorpha]
MNHRDRVIGINLLTKFHEDKTIKVASRVLTRKNAPPPADRVFKPIKTILVLVQDIMRTNLLTTFHEVLIINVTSRVLISHVFQPTRIIFELFHEDQTIQFGFRVSTRFYYSHIWKNDPPHTHLLTKFHEDWTINAASSVNNENF